MSDDKTTMGPKGRTEPVVIDAEDSSTWPPSDWAQQGAPTATLEIGPVQSAPTLEVGTVREAPTLAIGRVKQAPTYVTALPPPEEQKFQTWIAANRIPFDPSPNADYDMRGFYKALQSGDKRAVTAVNQSDNEAHFPDTWKTPYHKTFSNESIYAKPGAPVWIGDRLVAHDGTIIADESKPYLYGPRK